MSNPFFEISGEEIADLDDRALRELVGLLSEAEYRRRGCDTSGIHWGGDQDAPDGGFDVYIETSQALEAPRFLNRTHIGFQVKKPNMPPSKIRSEMSPNGVLRDSIRALIENAGAYIIISSGSSATKSALDKRVAAMHAAVHPHDPGGKLRVEFFDRGRLATWVRDHGAMVLWVKNRIGRSYNGWRPYERWAWVPKGGKDRYLLEDQVRLFDGTSQGGAGMSAVDGIQKLRGQLAIPRTAVRLTGLSGVGKTRLVQALFDSEIGVSALNPSNVLYTDVSDSPSPDPQNLLDQLVVQGVSAIIVLDNCPPELHRQAARICTKSGSKVSLISIEYDVREDLPPETNVYTLEGSGDELIKRLIRMHHSHVSKVDAEKIAEISGGNARLADALAGTIKKGETVSGFHDEDLFIRLFQQRHGSSDDLLSSAEALSLVYSFDGESIDKSSELDVLASIIGKKPRALFSDAAKLLERNLVQSRSKWRAVLPHAFANRLAASALKKYPPPLIQESFFSSGSERLIKSFTRRLGFLHDSRVAKEIIEDWLSPTGWIGVHIARLSPFGLIVLQNIAPVCPEETLNAILRASDSEDGAEFTSRRNSHHRGFVRLLRAIGFEAQFFEQCFLLITRFALAEDENVRDEPARNVLQQMCKLFLSGTWATPVQRLKVVSELCESDVPKQRSLGLSLLDATLEAWHFSSFGRFDFGARPRDFGYQPQNQGDIEDWFGQFLTYAKKLGVRKDEIGLEARKIIAGKFRGLWSRAKINDQIEATAHELHQAFPWSEGWIAVRETLFFDYQDTKTHANTGFDRLRALERYLRPKDLVQKARVYAMSNRSHDLEFYEDEAPTEEAAVDRYERAADVTREIGIDVANDEEALQILLPELLTSSGMRLHIFGEGLAIGAPDLGAMWRAICEIAKSTDRNNRNLVVMVGFIIGAKKRDSDFVNAALDDLLVDNEFAERFPWFQIAAGVDAAGLKRLHMSLDKCIAPIWEYERLGWGRAHKSLRDGELVKLLRKMMERPDGPEVAREILNMRLHREPAEGKRRGQSLLKFGRDLLTIIPLSGKRRGDTEHDYKLATIAQSVLKGKSAEGAARKLCERLCTKVDDGDLYLFRFHGLLSTLAELQPYVFLDVFIDSDKPGNSHRQRHFSLGIERHENPLSKIEDKVVLDWCSQNPVSRYQCFAKEAVFYTGSEESGPYRWKPLFFKFIQSAPESSEVLEDIAEGIRPGSWSGSLSINLEQRAALFVVLLEHENAVLRKWARESLTWLQQWIEAERQREDVERQARDESFE